VIVRPDPTESPQADSHSYFHRVVVRWQHRFDAGPTLDVTPSVGYDVPFQFALQQGNQVRSVDLETFSYNVRAVLRAQVRPWVRVDGGLDFEGNRWPIDVLFGPSGPPREGDPGGGAGAFAGRGSGILHDSYTLFTNHAAPFLVGNFTALDKRLVIAPQLRLEIFTEAAYLDTPESLTQSFVRLEPRLTARYQLRPWVAPKLAVGLYHEAPGPFDVSRVFGNPDLTPSSSIHAVAGADFDPRPALHIEAEGFYKDLRDLVVRGENPNDPLLTNQGIGRVYGGELLVRQELTKGFFGWIAYTLSRSERRDHPDQAWRTFQYDQTHILTLIGSYQFGRGYQLGLRYRFVTGNPYTPVTGAYYDASNDRYTPLYGSTYSARLAAFSQLDLRFDKAWTYNRWRLSVYLDIQNLTNRANPEGVSYNFDYRQTQPQSGIPFLPVFGLRGDL
jgi:hypothetical protein